MPNRDDYDMDSRPVSYWDDGLARLANIKGEMRRRAVMEAAAAGRMHELPPGSFRAELSKEEVRQAAMIHPRLMGGETLPKYQSGEVEIARVSLESIMSDVISVRAVETGSGLIRYRIVDDNGGRDPKQYRCRPKTSRRPLTLAQLIGMIDGADNEYDSPLSLPSFHRHRNSDWELSEAGLEGAARFVTVSSLFYRELERWYAEEAQEWLRARVLALRSARRAGFDPWRQFEETPESVKRSPESMLEREVSRWHVLKPNTEKVMRCVFFALVIRIDALRARYPGGLRGFMTQRYARYNQHLVILCDPSPDAIEAMGNDIRAYGLVSPGDSVCIDATDRVPAGKKPRGYFEERELAAGWLQGYYRDGGTMVFFSG